MAMRETVGSLRAYFVLVGALNTLGGILMLRDTEGGAASQVFGAILLLLGIGFLVAAARLPYFLATSTTFVKALVYSVIFLQLLFIGLMALANTASAEYLLPVLRILVCWYILVNVNRLAEENRKPAARGWLPPETREPRDG